MTLSTVRKAVGALLGSVTAGVIITVARAFGVDVDPTLAAAIATIFGTLGAYLAPPNAELGEH